MYRHDALTKGRYKRVPSRWETEFGRWVSDFSVPRIVAALARDRATAGAEPPASERFTLSVRAMGGLRRVLRKLDCGPDTNWIGRAEFPSDVKSVEVTGPASRRLLGRRLLRIASIASMFLFSDGQGAVWPSASASVSPLASHARRSASLWASPPWRVSPEA